MEYAALVISGAAKQLSTMLGTAVQPTTSLSELEARVSQAVLHLLRRDLPRLLQVLYRIDVEEHQVKQAMLAPSEEEMAQTIARLIIKRELQKAQTRFMYGAN
ncbi:MAG TPA: hypothetical protein VIG72_15150 [Pontibacter sp.]